MVIDENNLEVFREEHLHPTKILEHLQERRRVLLRLPVGVGKTFAADSLLAAEETYQNYDLVIYIAPTHAILQERPIIRGAKSPVPWYLLSPRPRNACGDLDEEWKKYESTGCIRYAKEDVCKWCPRTWSDATEEERCHWPTRYDDGLAGTKLIFATEANFSTNRSLVSFLCGLANSNHPLVILDEAKMLDCSFQESFSKVELRQFLGAVNKANHKIESEVAEPWIAAMEALLDVNESTLRSTTWDFSNKLNWFAMKLQSAGILEFGKTFRYLGYLLPQLQHSRPEERWFDEQKKIRFVSRPYMDCDTLILSAHLDSRYAGERLGLAEPIHSPFEDYVFKHSRTRSINIANRVGAQCHIKRANNQYALDFFATLIRRNMMEGKSTILIAKKSLRSYFAKFLTERLASWNLEVSIVPPDHISSDAILRPDIIPMLHYGVLGINKFEGYDCCYCLGSYYVPSEVLSEQLQDTMPERVRADIDIEVVGHQRRVPESTDPRRMTYLKKLEVDPVIQAIGRVRPFTKPREIITFQLHDLSHEIPGVVEVATVEAARQLLQLPRARDIDELPIREKAQELRQEGLSLREIAVRLGVSHEKVRKMLAGESCQRLPIIYIEGGC